MKKILFILILNGLFSNVLAMDGLQMTELPILYFTDQFRTCFNSVDEKVELINSLGIDRVKRITDQLQELDSTPDTFSQDHVRSLIDDIDFLIRFIPRSQYEDAWHCECSCCRCPHQSREMREIQQNINLIDKPNLLSAAIKLVIGTLHDYKINARDLKTKAQLQAEDSPKKLIAKLKRFAAKFALGEVPRAQIIDSSGSSAPIPSAPPAYQARTSS